MGLPCAVLKEHCCWLYEECSKPPPQGFLRHQTESQYLPIPGIPDKVKNLDGLPL